jgi:glycosyltransferase involved in cell wall biosynthesis
MHRRQRTGLRHFLRAEYGNWLLNLIRTRLAQHIVYQSSFSQTWWQRVYGSAPATTSVVYNGVDLAAYSADGTGVRPQERWRILMVEGSLMGGYEQGLESGMQLAAGLAGLEAAASGRPVELMVAGRVSSGVKAAAQARVMEIARGRPVSIHWAGLVAPERIPELDRSAHLLFSSDVNAACPNSVIEALACGCPVVAYATGALPEMVTGESGRLAAYGGDPWKLEPPDHAGLVQAAQPILVQQDHFRAAARERAVERFSLDTMVEGYLAALLG